MKSLLNIGKKIFESICSIYLNQKYCLTGVLLCFNLFLLCIHRTILLKLCPRKWRNCLIGILNDIEKPEQEKRETEGANRVELATD